MKKEPLFLAALLLFAGPTTLMGSKASPKPAKSLIEGVYTIEEWHAGDEVLRPPAIDGRFVLQDGVVVTILKNWSKQEAKISAANYGRYSLDDSGFSYSYQGATTVTETPSETKVSHKLIFDGTRTFKVTTDANTVRFQRSEGNIEFLFTPAQLTYSENGKVLRVWRRVRPDQPS